MAKHIAFAFGSDDTRGDSSFGIRQEESISTTKPLTELGYKILLAKYAKRLKEEESEELDESNTPVGFWILSVRDADAVFDLVDEQVWTDSLANMVDHLAKKLAKKLAVKTVSQPK